MPEMRLNNRWLNIQVRMDGQVIRLERLDRILGQLGGLEACYMKKAFAFIDQWQVGAADNDA
jgi:hypothetical protein